MTDKIREKWDQRYSTAEGKSALPSAVLDENRHLLPAGGKALDMACGRGGNALLLARSGFDVHAWDISPVAIRSLEETAGQEGLNITTEVRDVIQQPPGAGTFDVITVSYFLERDLALPVSQALRHGGLLFYQTFIRDKVSPEGPDNPDFLLAENELLDLFSSLCVRVYREEGSIGDPQRGFRNEAMLVAQRLP